MCLVCLGCNFWVDTCYNTYFPIPFWNMHTICLTKCLTHSCISLKLTSWFVPLGFSCLVISFSSLLHLGLLGVEVQNCRNQTLKSERDPAHEKERLGPQENKEWRSLDHGKKRIKYWALGRKKRHKEKHGRGA